MRALQVTGNATSSDERNYLEAGFTCTLGKPFTLEALAAAIEKHAAHAASADA